MASFKDRFHNHKKTSKKPLENSGRRPAHSEEDLNRTRPMTAVKHTSNGGRRPSNRGFFSSFWHYVTNSLRGNWKASLDKDSIFKERTKPPHMALAIITTTMKFMLIAVLILGTIGAGSLWGIVSAIVNTAPELSVDKISDTDLSSFIYDVNGVQIATYSGSENRLWASLDEIPEYLQQAVICTEDARFYSHGGIDIKRILGSFLNNMVNDSVEGASTLTQQLIKNTMLTPERSYKRKIQEAYLSIQLENKYTKDQILEAYLNEINLGQSNYGVKSAALDYFGKELKDLTLRECAMLAGLTQNPTAYDPRRNYYVRNTPEVTNNRTDTVLNRMYKNGAITKEEYDAAMAEELVIREEANNATMYQYPHFVEYVIEDVVNHFLEERGLEDTQENRAAIETELRTQGYHIYTTLDQDVQQSMEDTIYNYDRYPKTARSADSVGSNGLIQPQAAAVVYDYKTGQIRGLVGGRTAPKGQKELNRAYETHMPIGSSIKPIAVYGPAIDAAGLGAGSIIQNIPGQVNGWESTNGYPSGGSVIGPVTMRQAIVSSLNLSAARTLMELTPDGINNSLQYLEQLGVNMDSQYIQPTGAGLALGTSGISALDLTVAFGTIANKGKYVEPISFTRVEDNDHNLLLDATKDQETRQVFKESTAWMLTDILTDAVDHGTGTNARISGMTVAGKTGTNDNYRGISFAGYTPYYASAIWIGHDDYKPLGSAYGGSYAAPIFQRYMADIIKKKGLTDKEIIEDSPESLGLVKGTVCAVSGKKATAACTATPAEGVKTTATDWFLEGTVPTEPCDMHVLANFCADTGKLATENCPNVVQKSIVVIPPDSYLSHAKMDLIADALPWYFNTAASNITAQSYPAKFCEVHTADWAAQNSGRPEAVSNAQSVISSVESQMQSNYSLLTGAQVNELNTLISDLRTLINNATSTAAEISSKAQQLQSRANSIFSNLPQPTPTPSSTPTPSPTQPPETTPSP